MEEMYKMGIKKKFIYVDFQSGKDFNRNNYKKLKAKLKKNDLLVIKSIDRLGRNYDMIISEWQDITKTIEADIFVIDFPLLDTRVEDKNLVGKFIADIVLQVLSFVAQNERENIRQRQAEGIRLAKERGVHMGRPKYELPTNFQDIVKKFHNKELTNIQAAQILNMSRSTFFKYSRLYK
jgi:DNA invertase Pin-like site-specific DNA recombinase